MKEIDNLSNIKAERQIVIEELENQKEELLSTIDKTYDQIEEMKKNEVIQEYLRLQDKVSELRTEVKSIEDDIDIEELLNCDHIFANEELNKSNECEKGKYVEKTCSSELRCIKCGLNWRWIRDKNYEKFYRDDKLGVTKIKVIKSIIARQYKLRSFKPAEYLSYDLAKAIYDKIIECNPGIDDTTAKVYFEWAQKNILTKDMPIEKHKDRVRRLNAHIWPEDRYKN